MSGNKSNLKIKIRMGANKFDIQRGTGDVINLRGLSQKEVQEASDILVSFLKSKGFFG